MDGNQVTETKVTKTYKREVAFLLLCVWGACVFWGIFNPQAFEVMKFITLPVFTFATAAYGFDAYAKQLGQSRHN